MIAAVLLLLYAVVVTWLGPHHLERLTCRGIAPRLGVTLWLAAILGVIGAWLGALVIASVEAVHDGWHGAALSICLNIVGLPRHLGVSQPAGSIIALALIGSALIVTIRANARTISAIRRLRGRSRQHARAARVIGVPMHRPDVVVVSAPEPAVYCVAGQPPAIVVTTAAREGLDEPQLDAVLAHEHAHLSGHHHDLLVLLRALAAGLPKLPLFATAAGAVSGLLEMSADDTAARRHGRHLLLGGIVSLVETPLNATALGAAHTAVLARARRLATPAAPYVVWGHRVGLTAAIALTTAIPIAFGLACQL
jgi:Zn-dependent protease with chaperone function